MDSQSPTCQQLKNNQKKSPISMAVRILKVMRIVAILSRKVQPKQVSSNILQTINSAKCQQILRSCQISNKKLHPNWHQNRRKQMARKRSRDQKQVYISILQSNSHQFLLQGIKNTSLIIMHDFSKEKNNFCWLL